MPQPAERRFYLEHFRDRTLVIGGADPACRAQPAIETLRGAGVKVVRVLPARSGGPQGATSAPAKPAIADRSVVAIWRSLAEEGGTTIHLGIDDDAAVGAAAALAIRLRAHKLVILDPGSTSATDGAPAPFRHAGDDAGEPRPGMISGVLDGGVEGVNVCRPEDLEAELLTYTGAGTLYTADDYVTVRRMGIDDYDQAQRLIDVGIEDGYLKPRPAEEVAQLVVNGFGAFVGDTHLAGFAALLAEPYAGSGLAEVCALSTISRFSGEGVGRQVVQAIVRAAGDAGLSGVFACTVSPEAARFFGALGFHQADHDRIPAAKWAGYDASRRADVRALLRDVG